MKKLLSIVLCIVLFLGVFSLVGCREEKEQESFLPSAEPMSISVFSTAVVEASDTLVKQITATVYPLNAPDKSVDWSVHWNENNIGENAVVTDYITVEPTSDGALTANVYCHKAFFNSTILVRVTTRVGGHSADCVVRYVGVPNDMLLEVNGLSYTTDEIIPLEVRTTSTINIKAFDIYGNPTEYGTFEYYFNTGTSLAEIYKNGIKVGEESSFLLGDTSFFYDLDGEVSNNSSEYYYFEKFKVARYIFSDLFDGVSNVHVGNFNNGNKLSLTPLYTLDELELNLYNNTDIGITELDDYKVKFKENNERGSFFIVVKANYGATLDLYRQFQIKISPQSAQSIETTPSELEF